jgi:hypothetical protein
LRLALKYNSKYGPALAVAADLFRFAGFPKEATQFYKFAQNMDEQ